MKDYQKGVISIFLVIILIPTMVFSGMFVDLSRVKLAKGVATSAADLALNSLMANYDKDLSEFYGLMASCQNIEDFYEESAQFFLESLYSQGLSADDAESLMTYVSALLTNDEVVHDLFQMEVQTETKDLVSAYKGGNSTEASLGTSSVIIKDQIVEFMKYRAPIEIASGIIKRLEDTGAESVFAEAKEDEQLVEDKQAYAEAEESFMDAAFKTYKAVKEYENEKMSVAKLKSMLLDMKNARETYREITQLMVSNLNGTSGLTRFYRPTYKIDLYSYDKTSNKVYSRKEKDDSGNYVYYIDGAKITSLLDALEEDITDFKNKRKAVSDAVGDTLINADIGTEPNQYNAIQWWKKVDSLISTPIENFKTSAKTMLDTYAKVLAIEDCTLGEDIPANWKSDFNSLTQSVEDLQKNFLKADVKETGGNSGNMYLRLVNKLEKYSKENVNNTKPENVKLANGKTVTQAITEVDDKLSGHLDTLDETIKTLDKIIDGAGWLNSNPYSLDKLSEKADDYHTTFTTWKNNASVQDTKMAEADWKSIQDGEDGAGQLSTNKQEILDFKTRMVNIRSRLKEVKNTLESMKYNGKKIVDINSYDTLYNAVKSDIGENLTNSAISSKASSLFKDKFTPYSSDKNAEVASYNFEDAKYNPELKVSKPKFYDWLMAKDRFNNKSIEELDEKVEETKNKKSEKKDEGKNKEDEAKNANRWDNASKINLYNNSGVYAPADFPSGLDANGRFSAVNGLISSLSDLISSLVNFSFTSIRDNLYSTEYVMDMFSYATYDNEGKYNLYKDKNNGTTPNTTSDLEKMNEAWSSKEITDIYNQSLTNFKINSENNVLHGAEVEYVLYGKENKDNIKDVYANIFTIRYALNTLSGFQNFWSATSNTTASTITTIASGLSAATSGIVPVPIIKCVIILLLTAFETGEDLNRMQDGFPVELYKTDEDWRYAITGDDLNPSNESAKGRGCENGLFYSDYLYLFVYLGFSSEKSASEMYRRVGDLIQANMRRYTKKDTYMLKNARSYFELSATIRVNPLMLALPMAQEYSNNPKDKNDWCTFEIHETRGYS